MLDSCPSCKTKWPRPDLTEAQWNELFGLKAEALTYDPIARLRQIRPDITEGLAKTIGVHLAVQGVKCHNCDAPVRGNVASVCESCGALNYVTPVLEKVIAEMDKRETDR